MNEDYFDRLMNRYSTNVIDNYFFNENINDIIGNITQEYQTTFEPVYVGTDLYNQITSAYITKYYTDLNLNEIDNIIKDYNKIAKQEYRRQLKEIKKEEVSIF